MISQRMRPNPENLLCWEPHGHGPPGHVTDESFDTPGHLSPDSSHLRAAAVSHTAWATPATSVSPPLRLRRGQWRPGPRGGGRWGWPRWRMTISRITRFILQRLFRKVGISEAVGWHHRLHHEWTRRSWIVLLTGERSFLKSFWKGLLWES